MELLCVHPSEGGAQEAACSAGSVGGACSGDPGSQRREEAGENAEEPEPAPSAQSLTPAALVSTTPSPSISELGGATQGQQGAPSDVKSWRLHQTIKYEAVETGGRQKSGCGPGEAEADPELVIGDCATPSNSKLSGGPNVKRRCLFLAESATTSFFRRLDWSPRGELLVVPTGQYLIGRGAEGGSGAPGAGQALVPVSYVFLRNEYSCPALVLPSPDGTTSSIRFNPVTFCPLKASAASQNPFFSRRITPPNGEDSWLFSKKSCGGGVAPRYVFSVITLAGTIYIYDTQHLHPIVCARGLHFQGMNDASWSSDGHTLAVASSDGYITFIFFEDGELGEVLIPTSVPEFDPNSSTVGAACPSDENEDPNSHQKTLAREAAAPEDRENELGNSAPSGATENPPRDNPASRNSSSSRPKRRIAPTVLAPFSP
ncbi:WD domain G-beta repeat family protein [Cryptosporidium felis]|nr:WD domain G-beta repeat family protein [Cryptosporidium felis]